MADTPVCGGGQASFIWSGGARAFPRVPRPAGDDVRHRVAEPDSTPTKTNAITPRCKPP